VPRYTWKIEFDAENDADANMQCDEARDSFHSYYEDELEQTGDSTPDKPHVGGGPKRPKG